MKDAVAVSYSAAVGKVTGELNELIDRMIQQNVEEAQGIAASNASVARAATLQMEVAIAVAMLLAVGLFLLVFLAIYLRGHWLAILLIAGCTPVGLYLIFVKWLKFSLPQGFLGF